MNLVDEDNDVGVLLYLLDECFYALLELSAILGAGHDACHVETDNTLAEEYGRGVALGNHLCQAFHYGALAHAGFAYQYGVVLLAATQNLDDAHNFTLTAHYGVQLAFSGSYRQVG